MNIKFKKVKFMIQIEKVSSDLSEYFGLPQVNGQYVCGYHRGFGKVLHNATRSFSENISEYA